MRHSSRTLEFEKSFFFERKRWFIYTHDSECAVFGVMLLDAEEIVKAFPIFTNRPDTGYFSTIPI